MDKAYKLQYNLAVLQRKDKSISKILDMTSQAVVYEYIDNGWKRMNVEGTMFLYARNTAPFYGLFVMNRLSTHNYNLPLDDKIAEAKINSTFLMFRMTDNVVHGIWVFEAQDRDRIMETVNDIRANPYYPPTEIESNLAEKLAQNDSKAQPASSPVQAAGGTDIVAMFEKARLQSERQQRPAAAASQTPEPAPKVTTDELSTLLSKMQQQETKQKGHGEHAQELAPTGDQREAQESSKRQPISGEIPPGTQPAPFAGPLAYPRPFDMAPGLSMAAAMMAPPFGLSPFMAPQMAMPPAMPLLSSFLPHHMAHLQTLTLGKPLSMDEFRDKLIGLLQSDQYFLSSLYQSYLVFCRHNPGSGP